MFFKIFRTCLFICLLQHFSPLYSTPDLTIVGFVQPEDGIGKIAVNILETLGDEISANIILNPFAASSKQPLPPLVTAALHHPDPTPGKVALLTEVLWHLGRDNTIYMPQESFVKLAYSMLETTKIPNKWVEILNREFDAVIVPDSFLVKIYEDCGVHIPIFVVPIPMVLNSYFAHPIHSKFPSIPFIFGDASANKNPTVLIKAFAKAFGNNSKVRLMMRAGYIHPETRKRINHLITHYGLKNVTIKEGHLSLEQYIDYLSSLDCYINLSRGEGFSFIPREALALGVPVIIPNNTASTTICQSDFVRAVPSDKKGPTNPVYKMLFDEECGQQFDCQVKDVVNALRDVYSHYSKYAKKARQGRQWVRQYDYQDPVLKSAYQALIKPKQIFLGDRNEIVNGTMMTNSSELYRKYSKLIDSNSK